MTQAEYRALAPLSPTSSSSHSDQGGLNGRSRPERRTFFERMTKYILDPRRAFHRFFLHSLLCLFAPGVLCHDAMFATFEGPLLKHLNIRHQDFGLLYSLPVLTGVVSAPAASLVLRLGATRVIVVSGTIVFLGCVAVGFGVQQASFAAVLYGRVFFALFQSVLSSVAALVTFRLFKEEAARAFAYSFIIFANRVGAISGFFFSGKVLTEVEGNVQVAVWLSIVPTGICLIASLLFAYFYRGTSTARLVRPLLTPSRVSSQSARDHGSGGESSLALVKQLPADFWVLFIVIGCCYGVILPFETVAVNLFEERYGMDATTAGAILSVCPAFALLSPIFTSFCYEAKGQVRALLLACVCILTAISCMYCGVVGVEIYKLVLLLGAGYMLATNVVWVLVPQVVPQTGPLQTVAIGVAGMASSVFIAIGNFMVGLLRGHTGSYDASLLLLVFVSLAGLCCSVKLLTGQTRWKAKRESLLGNRAQDAVNEEVNVTRLTNTSPFIEPEYRRSIS